MPPRSETLQLRIVPNAKRSECHGATTGTGEIKIKLAAPAVDGKANKALVAYLSDVLGVSKSQIEIVRGKKSRQKTVAIGAIDADTALRRLIDASTSSTAGIAPPLAMVSKAPFYPSTRNG